MDHFGGSNDPRPFLSRPKGRGPRKGRERGERQHAPEHLGPEGWWGRLHVYISVRAGWGTQMGLSSWPWGVGRLACQCAPCPRPMGVGRRGLPPVSTPRLGAWAARAFRVFTGRRTVTDTLWSDKHIYVSVWYTYIDVLVVVVSIYRSCPFKYTDVSPPFRYINVSGVIA